MSFSPGIYRETATIATAADGTATVTLTKLDGYLIGWNADSGDLTDAWDFTITSSVSDADILASLGTNVPTGDEAIWFDTNNTPLRIPISHLETYTVNVTNGGNDKDGTLYLYYERF